MKKQVLAGFLALFGMTGPACQEYYREFTMPPHNPVMAGYVWEMSNALVHDWSMLRLDFVFNRQDGISQGNGFASFDVTIRQWDHLSFPVFGGLIGTFGDHEATLYEDKTYWDRQFIAGAGLQLRGRFGRLGGFAGYNWGDHEEYGTAKEEIHKMQWVIVPLIDAKEYPLLGYAVKLLDGFFSFDQADFKPYYQGRVLFRDLRLGNWAFGLAAVNTQNWFDHAAKYTLYSGKLNVSYKLYGVSLEGGYREFFDLPAIRKDLYRTGPYVRINFSKAEFISENFALGIFVESGRKPLFQDVQVGVTLHSTMIGMAVNAMGSLGAGGRTRMVISAFDYETERAKRK
ncbi:MAG: hypothetical protein LBP23_07655 [Treponema sp.]|jgi:hypothetical protein|nr:hypothetical protein [Treponema sp.]